jgi:hypothetical protein
MKYDLSELGLTYYSHPHFHTLYYWNVFVHGHTFLSRLLLAFMLSGDDLLWNVTCMVMGCLQVTITYVVAL